MDAHIDHFLAHLNGVRGASPHTLKAYAEDLAQWAEFARARGAERAARRGGVSGARVRRPSFGGAGFGARVRGAQDRRGPGAVSFSGAPGNRGRNPAQAVVTPRLAATLPHFLAQDQVNLLLAAPDPGRPDGLRDRAILESLYASGARAAELVALDLPDLVIDHAAGEGTLRIRTARAARSGLRCLVGPPWPRSMPILITADPRSRLTPRPSAGSKPQPCF
jgi:site-specific recombinase XerC